MISPRFAPAICALAAIGLVPVVIHGYIRAVAVDGLRIDTVPAELAGFASRPVNRDPQWGRENFDTDEWFLRNYRKDRDDVVLAVVRSYDAKRLYHHPELAVAYGHSFAGTHVNRLPHAPDVSLHVLVPGAGTRAFGAYALLYDGRFIDNPLAFQLRLAGKLLFSPRGQMTLFFAYQAAAPETADVGAQPSTTILLAAVRAFLESAPTEATEGS